MANRFKDLPKEEVKEVIAEKIPAKPTPPKKKSGIVKSLTAVFSGTFLTNANTLKHIPFILFLSVLGIFYIANGYWADNKFRQVNKVTAQLKELRSEFITTKTDLMFISKQSEVAKAVQTMGLSEPIAPPMKILVNDTLKK